MDCRHAFPHTLATHKDALIVFLRHFSVFVFSCHPFCLLCVRPLNISPISMDIAQSHFPFQLKSQVFRQGHAANAALWHPRDHRVGENRPSSKLLMTAALVCSAMTCGRHGSNLGYPDCWRVSAYRNLQCEDVEPACLCGDRSLFLFRRHLEGHYHCYMGCTAQLNMCKPFAALATSAFFLNVCILFDIHILLVIITN